MSKRARPSSSPAPTTPETKPAPATQEGLGLGQALRARFQASGAPYLSPRAPFLLARGLYDFFFSHWRAIHADALGSVPPVFRARSLLVLVLAALSLSLMEYYGGSNFFRQELRDLGASKGEWAVWARGVINGGYFDLYAFAYWSAWRFVGYVLLPLALILSMRGESLSDYGLSLRKAGSHTWVYVALFLAVFPAVFLASYEPGFQKTYPFYKLASRSTFDFLAFEALYALQFFSLEFFFRGFLLHALKRDLGAYAIFYMLVPYCMIHFGKPFAETVGAIGAGLILGTLSMRTRSIWGGVGIHVAVAVSMDTLALWQKGQL